MVSGLKKATFLLLAAFIVNKTSVAQTDVIAQTPKKEVDTPANLRVQGGVSQTQQGYKKFEEPTKKGGTTLNMKAFNKDLSKHPEQYYNIDSSVYKLLENRGQIKSSAKVEKGIVVVTQETTYDYEYSSLHKVHVNEERKVWDVNKNGYAGDSSDKEERYITINETYEPSNGYGTVALQSKDEIHYQADYKKDSTSESVNGKMGGYTFGLGVTREVLDLYNRNTKLAVQNVVPARKNSPRDPGIDVHRYEQNRKEMEREQKSLERRQDPFEPTPS